MVQQIYDCRTKNNNERNITTNNTTKQCNSFSTSLKRESYRHFNIAALQSENEFSVYIHTQ